MSSIQFALSRCSRFIMTESVATSAAVAAWAPGIGTASPLVLLHAASTRVVASAIEIRPCTDTNLAVAE